MSDFFQVYIKIRQIVTLCQCYEEAKLCKVWEESAPGTRFKKEL